MSYIERVMNKMNKFKGQLVTEEELIKCFDREDVVIDTITEGYLGIYNIYSESEKGIIQFVIENVRLYDVYLLDDEEDL